MWRALARLRKGELPFDRSGGTTRRSVLEVLVVPLTVAIIGGFFTTTVALIQNAETKRQTEAAQIAAVTKLAIEHTGQDFAVLAGALVTYGRRSVPILTNMLGGAPGKDPIKRRIVEQSLVNVAKIHGESETVGRAMVNMLDDAGTFYQLPEHESALRVIGMIRYAAAADFIKNYKPATAVRDFKQYDPAVQEEFIAVYFGAARALGVKAE
jgi:hypothetical protein